MVAAAGEGGGSAMPGSCEATAADGSARPESTSKGKQDNNNQQEQEQEREQQQKEREQHRTVRRLTHQPFDALSASPRPTFLTEKTTVGTVDLTRCVYAEEVVRCDAKPHPFHSFMPRHFDTKRTDNA